MGIRLSSPFTVDTIRGTHIAATYCSMIPHLEKATAASCLISHLKEEIAAEFPQFWLLCLPSLSNSFNHLLAILVF
jgi:hypothetical protein